MATLRHLRHAGAGALQGLGPVCGACGAFGQMVCNSGAQCDPGIPSNGAYCTCGGNGAPCCPDGVGPYGGQCASGLVCGSNRCGVPQLPPTCSGAVSTKDAKDYTLWIRDSQGCALPSVQFFANSEQEAVGCANRVYSGTDTVMGLTAPRSYPASYSAEAGGAAACEDINVSVFSMTDVASCATEQCIKATGGLAFCSGSSSQCQY